MKLLTHWRRDPAKKKHIRGMARVAIYFAVMGLGSALLFVRAARAQVAGEGLELGRQLSQRMTTLIGPGQHEVNKLRLNGQPIYVATSSTTDPATDVLDRFARHCAQNLAQSPREWASLGDQPGVLPDAKLSADEGVVRAGTDADGMVMCFVKTKDASPKLTDAVKAFAETGNLSALGELRYAYARTTQGGRTSVLTAWTYETFSVFDLAPPEGVDAIGEDFPDFPRPPASWRMLSARAEGTGYGLNVYRTKASPDAVVTLYETALRKLGYTGGLIPFAETDLARDAKRGMAFGKDGALLSVGVRHEDGLTFVAVGFAGAGPATRTTAQDVTEDEHAP